MGKLKLCVVLVCLAAMSLLADDDSEGNIFDFKTMAPVTGPYVGTANPVRGVPGGGLPWVITQGKGELKGDGRVVVRVKGLVLADDPAVPANLRLTNPIANFRAIVSCLTIDGNGLASMVNVSTGNFPATSDGDARIDETLTLPTTCFAPIVFVTTPGGAWLAVTGFHRSE